jgi:ribosomal protein S18 acetylase RimI-like enzyme
MFMEIRAIIESDLTEVAHVHVLAFPESGLTQLGNEAVRRYYLWQLTGPHDSLCIGAFDDEKMTGFCFAGVFRGAETGFLQKNLLFLIGQLITHPRLLTREIILDRVAYSLKAFRTMIRHNRKVAKERKPPSRSFGILSIAVRPDYQGAGIGKLLMQNAESIACKQGFGSMRLSVKPDNQRAIIFYEKSGWQKTPAAEGVWRGLMTKTLDSSYGRNTEI